MLLALFVCIVHSVRPYIRCMCVCVFVSGHYIHVCVRMLTVRPCLPPCENGGTCNDGTCACTSGFTGDDCGGKDSVCTCVHVCVYMCVYVCACVCVCVRVDTCVCVSQFLQTRLYSCHTLPWRMFQPLHLPTSFCVKPLIPPSMHVCARVVRMCVCTRGLPSYMTKIL